MTLPPLMTTHAVVAELFHGEKGTRARTLNVEHSEPADPLMAMPSTMPAPSFTTMLLALRVTTGCDSLRAVQQCDAAGFVRCSCVALRQVQLHVRAM